MSISTITNKDNLVVIITMKVAELATKENIALTAQQLKEIVDYIINALKELK